MGSYDMKSTARCLAALADESRHSFLVSTANLRGPNEVRLLRYSEEDDDVRCAAIWHHNYEVSSLSSNATEPTLLATAYSTLDEKGARATVWRLTDLHEGGEGEDGEGGGGGGRFSEPLVKDLGVVAELPQATAADGGADPLFHVQWAPQVAGHDADELVTAHAGSARSWRLRADGSVAPAGVARFPHEANFVGAVAWDPHRPAEVAVAADAEVVFWDLRSGECARSVGGAVAVAGGVVRAVSFNPNKPFHVATAGDDFGVKIWDARRPSAPLKILEGHSHWATCAAFNPFHDQLLLSGGADCRTDLWRVSSVSSAPLLELGEEEDVGEGAAGGGGGGGGGAGKQAEPRLAADQAVTVNSDHEDSVTAIAWSLKSAWVYASVSYTGRVAVSQVPSQEKYRVLL